MKIIRSKGQSFTEHSKDESNTDHLERGLEAKRERKLVHSEHKDKTLFHGRELAQYVGEDHALVLRQAISVLDKVIRPPRRLRDFELQAYVDRAKLAHELWLLVLNKCKGDFTKHPDSDEVQKIFEKTWSERAHPYTRDRVQPLNPCGDENGKYLQSHPKEGVTRQDFEGRWYSALWQENNTTRKPDYATTAQAIIDHLFKQELQFDGQERTKSGHNDDKNKNSGTPEPTGKGLVEARGLTIKDSVNDPRMGKQVTKNADLREASKEIDSHYFGKDIAHQICSAFKNRSENDLDFNPAGEIGALLYNHLPTALGAANGDEHIKSAIWKRHNQVRQFYQKLLRTNRFKRAFRTRDMDKLDNLLPKDTESLTRVLDAKAENAYLSELIRLGKVIAHAADIPLPPVDGENLQDQFKARLEHFATSAGQSEIKRNETFTRLWRTSTALSLRTLTAWVEPILGTNENNNPRNFDITDNNFRGSLNHLLGENTRGDFSWDRIKVIFGQKAYPALCDISDKGRSHIFSSGESQNEWQDHQEVVWALVRLATQIRHGTNHFNVRHRLVDEITGGLLTGDNHPQHFHNRPGNIVHSSMLERFDKLLAFDTRLQWQVLLDDLNAFSITKYLNNPQLTTLLQELIKGQTGTDLATPKFMALLRRAANLARAEEKEYGEEKMPEESEFLSTNALRRFGPLELTDLSKKKDTSLNDVRIDLFRHLYRTGFPAWLEEKRVDDDYLKNAIRAVFDARAFREEAFAEEQRIVAQGTLLESSDVDAISDLSALFATLAANAAGEERLRRNSRARAKTRETVRVQSGGRPDTKEKPSWQATLREDIYGHLFAEYLNEEHLSWIWDIKEPHNPIAEDLKLGEIPDLDQSNRENWESQFYTWLYLVPSDQVSLLRHQLHKTLALDAAADKSVSGSAADEQDRATLSRMSNLMALYTAVQEAGFDGNEHVEAYGEEADYIFYADHDQFKSIHSQDDLTNTVPGTRRGLRQILKFGHLSAVQRIYEKHRVTQAEAEDLIELYGKKRGGEEPQINDFTSRSKLHKEIEGLWEKQQPREKHTTDKDIEDKCKAYKTSAIKMALHNFNIASARLTDHADLHHLLIRVVTRLLDFTLTWERDRNFLYLGMLCDKLRTIEKDDRGSVLSSTLNLELHHLPYVVKKGKSAEKKRWSICLKIGDRHAQESAEIGFSGSDESTIQQALLQEYGLLRLWDDEMGLSLDARDIELDLLPTDHRCLFIKYFVKLAGENEKDVAAREKAPKNKPITDHSQRSGAYSYSYKISKKQIRNDFAHFNILTKERLNLTYLTNAVRSLVSYDRKLKNAVSTAIADIVSDAGLEIQWTLERDRLKKPLVIPRVVHHLAWLPKINGEDVSFYLPARSARFTSMVKALFDFGTEGNVVEIEKDGTGITGRLEYPSALAERYTITKTATDEAGDGGEIPETPAQICLIPSEILTSLENLPQEESKTMIKNRR
ncbi:MAG: hypothetical protein GYB33_09720 [Gammaproteobacteria bacterium]|nr:hypothetical protein [Gammaproteobacteria bacterium]